MGRDPAVACARRRCQRRSPAYATPMSFFDLLRGPDRVVAVTDEAPVVLQHGRAGEREAPWRAGGIEVALRGRGGDALAVTVRSPRQELTRIQLRWRLDVPAHLLYLGDHWERAYGDAAWRTLVPERPLPWYVLVHDGQVTHGYGVEVQPHALCCWQIDDHGVSLWLEVASGGRGVVLGERVLEACTLVTRPPTP